MKKLNNNISNYPVKVSICCAAFNQEKYIRDCLNGFIKQKTNFKFEVLVHDDCSIDGTAIIIKEFEKKYPDIVKPLYEIENQYSKGVNITYTFNLSRAKGEYVAFCEGDDYWLDPLKLQKQIDFLEKNHKYGMCYTKTKNFIQKDNSFNGVFGGKAESFNELIKHNTIPTMTVCCRKKLLLSYKNEINPQSKNWLMGDYPQWLWFSYNSKIKFMPIITSVYRILEESASHSNNIETHVKFAKSFHEIKAFFMKKYKNVEIEDFDVHNAKGYFWLLKCEKLKAYNEFCLVTNKTFINTLKFLICKYKVLYKLYHLVRYKKR